jgi:Zn-dependent protease
LLREPCYLRAWAGWKPARRPSGQTGVVNRTGSRPSPIFLAIIGVAVLGAVLCVIAGPASALTGEVSGLGVFGIVLLVLGGWGVSLCLHEWGHAIVAFKGGDSSVLFKGYLNLDPRKYSDPVFSLLLPLLFLLIGGIPLPGGAVWINHGALRSKRIESFTSLAGPVSNLVFGVVLGIVTGLVWPGYSGLTSPLAQGLACLGLLQIVAFILNILPIPGLDGWGAIEPYLSYEARRFGAQVRPWAPLVLFVLLFAVSGISQALYEGSDAVFGAFGGNGLAASLGLSNFQFWR